MKRSKAFLPAILLCLIALLAIWLWQGQPRFEGERFPTWLKRLHDPDPAIRLRAVQGVTVLSTQTTELDKKRDRAVPALIDVALHETVGSIRAAALTGLSDCCRDAVSEDGKARKRQAVRVLLDGLKDEDAAVRARAPQALAMLLTLERNLLTDTTQDEVTREMGPEVLQALSTALSDKDARVRSAAVAILARARTVPPEAEEGLIRLARSDNLNDQRRAVQALAHRQPLSAHLAPALLLGLRSRDKGAQRWARIGLDNLGGAALPALLIALEDRDNDYRRRVRSLFGGNIAWARPRDEDVNTTIKLLHSPYEEANQVAVRLLRATGSRAVRAVSAVVREGPPEARWRAAVVLSSLGPEGVGVLRALQDHPDEAVRRAASSALRLALAPAGEAVGFFALAATPRFGALVVPAAVRAQRREWFVRRARAQMGSVPAQPAPDH